MSQKRRTLWGTPGVRISAGRQHIASCYRVNAKSSTFLKIFLSARHELERAANSIDHPMLSTRIEFAFPDSQDSPDRLPKRAHYKPISGNILVQFRSQKLNRPGPS